MRHWIRIAKKKAAQSPSKYRISAIGFNAKGEYLGSAFNSLRFNKYGGGIHAEMALIHRYGTRIKSMIICRIGLSGNLLPIDPCPRCQRVLDKLGIKVTTVKGEE